jgi:putative transcriptional regulator
MNLNDFPSLVKKIREVRGLTQEQLARDLDVTFGTVNGWENGKHRPIQALAARIRQMAREAGISVSSSETVGPPSVARRKQWPRGRR